MTTFTHPKLLEAIQKSCPELMEIGVGCQISGPNKILTIIAEKLGGYIFNDGGRVWTKEEIKYMQPTIILGREPQLHHVLRTIGEADQGKEIIISSVGGFYLNKWTFGYHFPNKHGEVLTWDFAKGLYTQKEEILSFLESLLVTK